MPIDATSRSNIGADTAENDRNLAKKLVVANAEAGASKVLGRNTYFLLVVVLIDFASCAASGETS